MTEVLFYHLEQQPLERVLPSLVERTLARGWRVTESLCTFAMPAGTTVQRVYEAFRDEILADLAKVMPVDGVLLSLHGAMVADATESCETDLVERIRAVVGPRVPIGVELDLHCHLTDELVAASTAIVIFKEYPHTDVRERAAELFDIVAAALEGRAAPRMALFDCRMLGLYPTGIEPMASFVRKIRGLEGRDGVLSISIAHGFPWGDVSQVGTRVLVVTDGDKDDGGADGRGLARTLGLELRALRPRMRRRGCRSMRPSTAPWQRRRGRSCSPTWPTTPAAAHRATPRSSYAPCWSGAWAMPRSAVSGTLVRWRSASATVR